MPETPTDVGLGRNYGGVGGGLGWDGDEEGTKGTEEKQGLLGRYLGNVGDLVEDLRESAGVGIMGR